MINKIATDRKINSVWTLEYQEVGNDKIRVISYSRDNDKGYELETKLNSVDIVEDNERNIIGVRIGDCKDSDFRYQVNKQHFSKAKYFKVVNVGFIFDFPFKKIEEN